jgi:hypothetical protein
MHANPKPEARTWIRAHPRHSQTPSVSQSRPSSSNTTAYRTNCRLLESFTAHWYQPCPPRISYLRRDTADFLYRAVQCAVGWPVRRVALRQVGVRPVDRTTRLSSRMRWGRDKVICNVGKEGGKVGIVFSSYLYPLQASTPFGPSRHIFKLHISARVVGLATWLWPEKGVYNISIRLVPLRSEL